MDAEIDFSNYLPILLKLSDNIKDME